MPVTRRQLNYDFVRDGLGQNFLDSLFAFGRASSATRINASGVLETVGNNVPRFDFDAVGNCRGLLLEESRTNHIATSNDLSVYNTHEASVAAGVASDLGGLAYKLQESAGNSFHYVGINTFAVPTTGPFAVSVYAKMVERRYFQLLFDNTVTTVGAFANFDLQTGTVVHTGSYGGSTINASISAAKNGWYRCVIIVGNIDSSASARLAFMSKTGPTEGHFSSHVGTSGHGFLLQYPQVEVGPFATSYIPTSVGTATRAGDLCYASTIVPWLDSANGTVFAEFSASIHPSIAASPIPWKLNSNHYMLFDGSAPTGVAAFVSNGTPTIGVLASGIASGATVKTSYSFRPGRVAGAGNGGSVVAFNVSADAANQLVLGAHSAGNNIINGHLRRFIYLPFAVDDYTLKALTQ